MSRESKDVNKAPARGAAAAKTGFGDVVQAWWKHHHSSARDSLARLLATPLQTLMTVMVVAIAVALPATLLTILDNVQQVGERWDSSPKLSAFVNPMAQQRAIDVLISDLEQDADIEAVEFIPADQALRDFQERSGFSEVLNILDENPLPHTIVVTPKLSSTTPTQLLILKERIEQEAVVQEVDMDMDWVRRLKAIMAVGEKMVLGLATLLCLGVLLSIGNTIRLAIENRREEIIIAKLVGATDGFVRRPFLYTGAWYGALGGILASFLVTIGFALLGGSVSVLSSSYSSDFRLAGLGVSGVLSLMFISVSLGLFGAWLAVGRHLSEIEPR